MQFVLGLIVVVMISLGAGWAYFGTPTDLSIAALGRLLERATGEPPKAAQGASAQKVPALAGADVAANRGSPFDIAKVEPDGTSVFAGRATPKSLVTVLADGEPIGTVTADENGEWVLMVERSFANRNPQLSVAVGAHGGPGSAALAQRPNGASSSEGRSRTAAAATAQLMNNLQHLVDRARSNSLADQSPAAAMRENAEAPASLGASGGQPAEVADVQAKARSRATEPGTAARGREEHHVVPIPIKFAFRQATFTDDGRKAAQLLLEYVLLEKIDSLKLTGHADERGTPAFNMELSAARLNMVAKFLRAGGYNGKLDLLPMGESAPFRGVDRNLFPQEELFELDRRVELRLRD
jgi:outer membrane protein OmpA-like peptidoglycan-associated protein